MKKYLYMLYVLTNLLDLGFTTYGVSLTGPGLEANPVARDILLSQGVTGLSLFKLGGVAFVLAWCAMIVRIKWGKPWGKHLDTPILLAGVCVSLVGAWSWVCVF